MVRAHKHFKRLICQGIKEPLKISLFADDTFFFIKDQKDYDLVFSLLNTFMNGTNANVNVKKTEILPIGPNSHSEKNKLKTGIDILP